jgi:hypothetical protein
MSTPLEVLQNAVPCLDGAEPQAAAILVCIGAEWRLMASVPAEHIPGLYEASLGLAEQAAENAGWQLGYTRRRRPGPKK